MNINDLIGLKSCNVDSVTGLEVSYREKYSRIIRVFGFENVKNCIPFTLSEIKKALPKDAYLNNLQIKKWCAASGVYVNDYSGEVKVFNCPLVALYRKHGINSFSQSDGVCILKECARIWAEIGD